MVFNRIGRGEVVKLEGDRCQYKGSIPEDCIGKPVIIMKESDLEVLATADMNALLAFPYSMDEKFYSVEDPEFLSAFPDKITFTPPHEEAHKLYLDRHFYSTNLKDMMWLRYVDVDQSIIEEGVDGDG